MLRMSRISVTRSGWRRPFCPSALGVSVQDEAIGAIAIWYLFHRAGAHRAARTVVDPVSPGFGPAANRVSLIVTHSYRHVSAVTRCRYPHLLQPDDGNRRGRGSYGVVCDGQRNRSATARSLRKRVAAHSRWRRHGSRKARANSKRLVGENGSSDCELSFIPRSIVDGKDVSRVSDDRRSAELRRRAEVTNVCARHGDDGGIRGSHRWRARPQTRNRHDTCCHQNFQCAHDQPRLLSTPR